MPAPDERRQFREERFAGRDVAGDRSGLDEGRALPVLAERLVVVEGEAGGERHRGGARVRPQPVVDAVDVAVRGPVGQELHQPLRQLDEEGLRIAAGGRGGGAGLVEDDEVDVARIVQLAAAELAQAEDDQAGPVLRRLRIRGPEPPGRHPLPEQRLDRPAHRGVREGRQGLGHRVEIPAAAEIGQRDQEGMFLPVGAQPPADLAEVGVRPAGRADRALPGDDVPAGRVRRLFQQGDEPVRRPGGRPPEEGRVVREAEEQVPARRRQETGRKGRRDLGEPGLRGVRIGEAEPGAQARAQRRGRSVPETGLVSHAASSLARRDGHRNRPGRPCPAPHAGTRGSWAGRILGYADPESGAAPPSVRSGNAFQS